MILRYRSRALVLAILWILSIFACVCSAARREQHSLLPSSRRRCPPGKYAASHIKYLNSYTYTAPFGRKVICLECPLGKYARAGTTGKCTSCPVGKYGTKAGQGSEEAGCAACPSGKFQRHEGQPLCQKCTRGKWSVQTGAGSTTCSSCVAGKYILSPEAKASKIGVCLPYPGYADALHDYLNIFLHRYDSTYFHHLYSNYPFLATLGISFCLTLGPGSIVLIAMGLINRLKRTIPKIREAQEALPDVANRISK